MMNTTKTKKLYYFPVEKQGDRYIEAPESILMGAERPVVPELEEYLKKHYIRAKSEVELNGNTYFTDVYVPNQNDDLCYVIANADGMPLDEEHTETVNTEHFIDYIEYLYERLSYAEGISPDQIS